MFLYLYILILKYFYNNICIIINPIKMNGSNFSSSFNPPDFLIPTALHLKKSIVFDSKTTKESKSTKTKIDAPSRRSSRLNPIEDSDHDESSHSITKKKKKKKDTRKKRRKRSKRRRRRKH